MEVVFTGLAVGVAASLIAMAMWVFGASTAIGHTIGGAANQLLQKKRMDLGQVTPQMVREKARILIIDDEDYAHYETLSVRGFKTVHWRSISTAKAQKLDHEFEVVLLDVKDVLDDAGASNGLDALHLLRRDNPWVPIIIFTSHLRGLRGKRNELAASLAQGVVKKITPFNELLDEIVDTAHNAFKPEYFAERLDVLGVEDGAAVVATAESEGIEAAMTALVDSNLQAGAHMAAVKVLRVVDEVCSGTRWE